MVTYTLGLADGLMLYDPNYETAPGDFANIKPRGHVCFWAGGHVQLAVATQDQQSALDDLWHTPVNGRGTYFLALNPRTLANALQNALSSIAGRNASAAAAATSSPNITPKDISRSAPPIRPTPGPGSSRRSDSTPPLARC